MEKRTIELTDEQRAIVTDALLKEALALSRLYEGCKERGIDTSSLDRRQIQINQIINLIRDWWEE